MPSIFISHSSADNFEAVALHDWLALEGWDDVFLDTDPERGIAAGERWERALHEAALRCEAVIFVISAHWLASRWCLKEYNLARSLNKKLFAVVVDPNTSIAELPLELKGTWQVVELASGQDGRLMLAKAPVSHEERHVAFSKEGLRRLKRGLEKAGLDPKFFTWPPDAERDRSPYRGLKALEKADAGIFFGREASIVEAADRLRGLKIAAPPRLLVILGASGAGKSSFLRAGLLPRLERDERNFLALPVIRPERAALTGENGLLHALEAVLPGRTRAEIRTAVLAGSESVRPLLAELVAESVGAPAAQDDAKPPTIVLAIDQAEELFRAKGAGEGDALLRLVRDLARQDRPAVITIFAIRSDSYDALEHAKPLEGLRQSALPLLPLPRGAYKDVIEGPARRYRDTGAALTIEPQLTERLLGDIDKGGGSDALPMLAFTLEQLFLDYRRSGALRLKNYEEFSGLKGAVDAAVERAFARADADPRIPRERKARETLLRRGLIPWLAGIDPDSKSPRRNIARRADIPAEAAPLIDLLVEERLLTTDTATTKDAVTGAESRTVTIEPAHEALLRQWGLLQGWLEEDCGLLATLEGVQRAAREWDANGRVEAWLAHGGLRLAEAQALDARADIAAKLDVPDRAYLARCRAKEEAARAEAEAGRREREEAQARQLEDARQLALAERKSARRTRYALLGVIIAAGLALAAAGIGLYAREEALLAREQKTELEAAQLDARNKTESARKQSELAALRHAQYLVSVAQQKLGDSNFTSAQLLALEAVKRSTSPGMASQLPSAAATLFEAVRENREMVELIGHEKGIESAAFSPDGERVVTASNDNLSLWDAVRGVVIRKFEDAGGPAHSFIRSAEISSDGRRVMSIDVADARLWDVESGRQISSVDAHLAWFRSDGSQLVVAGRSALQVVDPETKATRATLDGDPSAILSGAFSRDGARFATSGEDRIIRVWETTGWRMGPRIETDGRILFLAFSADGAKLAAAAEGGRYLVYDVASGSVLADSSAQRLKLSGDCRSMSFSPDGRQIFIASKESSPDVWDFADAQDLRLRGHKDSVTDGGFGPDGGVIATASKDGTARLWDAGTGVSLAVLAGHDNVVATVRFSPDGSRVLTASSDASIRIWKVADPLGERVIANAGPNLRTAVLSPDASRLAALTEDGSVRIVDTARNHEIADVEGVWNAVAFDPSGERLALASNEGKIRLVNAASRATISEWDAGDDPIDSLAFAPDGRRLASGSDTGTVRLWQEAGGAWAPFGDPIAGNSGVVVAKFDGAGAHLMTAGFDGSLSLVDAGKTKSLWTIRINDQTARSIAFAPDGRRAFVGGEDRFVTIWDVATGKAVGLLAHDAPVRTIEYDVRKDRLITVTRDGTVRIWRADEMSGPNAIVPEITARTRFDKLVSAGVDERANRYVFATSGGDIGQRGRIRGLDDLVDYAKTHAPRALTKIERGAYALE